MIVSVQLAITTDDGMPCVIAEERQVVVQTHADYEGNLLKSAAALDDLVRHAQDAAVRQVRQYREVDPELRRPPAT